jgi:hypothetical protein
LALFSIAAKNGFSQSVAKKQTFLTLFAAIYFFHFFLNCKKNKKGGEELEEFPIKILAVFAISIFIFWWLVGAAVGGLVALTIEGCSDSNDDQSIPGSPTCPGGSQWEQCAAKCSQQYGEYSESWNQCMSACLQPQQQE